MSGALFAGVHLLVILFAVGGLLGELGLFVRAQDAALTRSAARWALAYAALLLFAVRGLTAA